MIVLILVILIFAFSLVHYSKVISTILYLKRDLLRKYSAYYPKASIIMPCKGVDREFRENLNIILNQSYKDYEIIFSIAKKEDPAYDFLKKIKDKKIRLVVGEKLYDRCSEKLSNLLNALPYASGEVLVFLDSDLIIDKDVIRNLILPLQYNRIGATTGYRHYIPRNKIYSYIRSVYNLGSMLFIIGENNFTYGGATAIRKELFYELNLDKIWQNSFTDDMPLTNAVKHSGKKIKFCSKCIGLSYDENKTLLENQGWINRQVKIMQIYHKKMWFATSIIYLFFLQFLFFIFFLRLLYFYQAISFFQFL